MPQITVPEVVDAYFLPNPAYANTKTTLEVLVTERIIQLRPEVIYSGEVYSGEA